ncbi:MAG: dihydrodipicolinate synthase family protein [Candidatus Dormibacteraeota bacterium]|nr:dihydrodipicolinate synthase family protein [Candidatus Dormibacteraeota bacterium]
MRTAGSGGSFRGVFAIPPTPFTDRGDLDEGGLRRVLRFCVDAGVHGIVTPVNASEFAFLTDDERRRVIEIAAAEAGVVPVVAGVAGSCTQHAVLFAGHARAAGVAAVIAMPPYVRTATRSEIREYYEAIADAARIPVFIQNHLPPQGTPMSPEFVAELVREIPLVSYVKEECWPPGQHMSAELELAGPSLLGVMGGIAGRYLIEEYRRGACGTMPASEIPDVHVQLWERLEAGDEEGARRIFEAMLPLLNLEAMHGVVLYKHVLHRRGLIESSRVRQPGLSPLDQQDREEIDTVLENLRPLFRIGVAEPR